MIKHINTILTIIIAFTACSGPKADDKSNPSSDTAKIESTSQKITGSSSGHYNKIQADSLPIHGGLNQKQIDKYYPNVTDTIKDRRIIGSEPISIQTKAGIYVSMLHNSGTFDQMFLCTHDKNFNLLDCYHIGTSTTFDKTSHTIEYNKISDDRLEFHHVDWGYVKKDSEEEIDTLKYTKYVLRVMETGKIEKE